jgi:hypothetical protein
MHLILFISDVEDVQPDEIDEQFWGEILERTVSVNNMNFGNGEFGRDDLDSLGGEKEGMGKEGAVGIELGTMPRC